VVLLHGIAGTSATWDAVLPRLAAHYDVLAPDLLGHGESAKPHGDYSLGAYANAVRDLLEALGENRATFVGHSLGGGVAMQFAYQFLERCERLVLVDSGGLGREVHPLLRAAALPGAGLVLPWLSSTTSRGVGALVRGMRRLGIRAGPDLDETWRSFVSLEDPAARRAFIQTVRGVMDLSGQRVSANERLYLAEGLPTLIVWGENDPLLPVRHARAAHERMPGSRLEIFPEAGHFPHRDDPERFAGVLGDFIRTTKPLPTSAKRLGDRLRAGPAAPA
jgi:pimeloyl-ACP methyl ester carboxylesterase